MARNDNREIQRIADLYCRSRYAQAIGVPGVWTNDHYVSVSRERGAEIADEYSRLPVLDSRPLIQRAYRALEMETTFQFEHIVRSNYSLLPWTEPGQPYADSAAMCADLRDNGRLYFFTGGESHPFLNIPRTFRYLDSRLPALTGNDMLRAVHDVFGHAACGFGFGARGEENAWIHHSMMFSRLAQLALTSETRGQNSWVNFGPHASLPAPERPYATQKAALLPAWVTDWRETLRA